MVAEVEVQFALRRGEFASGMRAGVAAMRSIRVFAVISVLLTLIGLLDPESNWWMPGITWLVFAALMIFVLPYFRWARSSIARAEQVHLFGEDEIVVRIGETELRTTWSYYNDVLDRRSLYVLMREGRPCVIIPKRAFASPADHDQFVDLTCSKIAGLCDRAKPTPY